MSVAGDYDMTGYAKRTPKSHQGATAMHAQQQTSLPNVAPR